MSAPRSVDIVFQSDGTFQAVASELEDALGDSAAHLHYFARVTTRRASRVEPCASGPGWMVDLTPVGGPVLGPIALRREALAIERRYLADVLGL